LLAQEASDPIGVTLKRTAESAPYVALPGVGTRELGRAPVQGKVMQRCEQPNWEVPAEVRRQLIDEWLARQPLAQLAVDRGRIACAAGYRLLQKDL
jgi:hypothetical protein